MVGYFCRVSIYAALTFVLAFGVNSGAHAMGGAPVVESDPLPAPTLPQKERRAILHSHNDYDQASPLFTALAARFESVEADVWQVWDQIKISHNGFSFKGTLRELYLDPLQKRVDVLGTVYGDGKPFYLWLDIKDFSYETMDLIHAQLQRYPMLTVFRDGEVAMGPVTVILTGNDSLKKNYVNKHPVRFATRDSNQWSKNPAPADNRWLWYALSWKKFFKWDGLGEMPAQERTTLRKLVETVRARGKRLRLWEAPDTTRVWNECMSADVDMLGTDRLVDLRQFTDAP